MKKRKFADGGETPALDDLAEGKDKGRFDTDVYARAKRFLESAKAQPATPRKAAPVERPNPRDLEAGMSRGTYGVDVETPKVSGPTQAQIDEYERIKASDKPLEGVYPEQYLVPGIGALRAAGLGRAASEGWKAGRAAREIAKGPGKEAVERAASSIAARPQAAQVASNTSRFTPTQELEAAESAVRGAASRGAIQARRAEAARDAAATMERSKPVMQARPNKPSPRSRVRDEEVEYGLARGGKVRGGGIEKRGKTRGKFV